MSNQYALYPSRADSDIRNLFTEAKGRSRVTKKEGDINPGDLAPVLYSSEGKTASAYMRWGFPNHWNGGEVYAARAETAEDRTTFRKSLEERRCIIPTTGFYDKKTTGEDAGRYIFHLNSTHELFIAGIYNGFKNDDTGKEDDYFAMLTVPANASLEEFNDRMPLVLRKSEFSTWLTGDYESLLEERDIKLRHKRDEE